MMLHATGDLRPVVDPGTWSLADYSVDLTLSGLCPC
jgi:hypothetical protein